MAGIRRVSDLGTKGVANIVDGSVTEDDIAINTIGQGRLGTSVPLSGFRNVFINSTYAVDQRGRAASHTVTAGAALSYTVDRWYEYCTGANVTAARNTYTPSFVLPVLPYYHYTFTGAANNTGVGFGQRIESISASQLAGQLATLSGIIWSSASTTVTWTAYYANTVDSFGTLASPTRTQIATGTFSTSPVGFVPQSSNAVKVSIIIPLEAVNGIEIVLSCSSLTAGQTLSISCMQLEVSEQTRFEQRPIGAELALCQRYYWRSDDAGLNGAVLVGGTESTTLAAVGTTNPVTMRAAPSITLGSGIRYYSVATSVISATVNTQRSSKTNAGLYINITGGTAGQAGYIFNAPNANSYIEVACEL